MARRKHLELIITKHTVIARKGRTCLIILSILTLIGAIYLMHLDSVDRPYKSPAYKTAAR